MDSVKNSLQNCQTDIFSQNFQRLLVLDVNFSQRKHLNWLAHHQVMECLASLRDFIFAKFLSKCNKLIFIHS
jgi:hypothetical protein